MKEELKGSLTEEQQGELTEKLPEIARHCSARERAADEAERETVELKKVEFMKEKVGETFDAIISNVTSFGMFVELENSIEGLVRLSNMDDDYYILDEKHYCLIGEHTKKRYRIGDQVSVLLVRADLPSRQLDFILAGETMNEKKAQAVISGQDNSQGMRKNEMKLPKEIRKRTERAPKRAKELKVSRKVKHIKAIKAAKKAHKLKTAKLPKKL